MNYSKAAEIIFDSVFNAEYQASREQEEAYYTVFPDKVNYPQYSHPIADEHFRDWAVRWSGRTYESRYKTTYFKEIDGRFVTVVIESEQCTLMTDAQYHRYGITADVKTLEDIERLLHYDGIDYEFQK